MISHKDFLDAVVLTLTKDWTRNDERDYLNIEMNINKIIRTNCVNLFKGKYIDITEYINGVLEKHNRIFIDVLKCHLAASHFELNLYPTNKYILFYKR